MEAFENMKSRTKIILTVIGASAVLVPVALLMFVSQNTQIPPQENVAPRQIDQIGVGGNKELSPSPSPILISTPSPITATPTPVQNGSEVTPTP